VDAVPAVLADIVAGGDVVSLQVHRMFEKSLELDFPVTEDIRIGSASRPVFCEKILEYKIPIFRCEIAPMQRDADRISHRLCILGILGRGAGAEAVILFPVLHEHCGNRQPLVPQQQGCDSRINAAGQGYHNQSSMVRNCIHGFLNGDSVPIKKSPQAFR